MPRKFNNVTYILVYTVSGIAVLTAAFLLVGRPSLQYLKRQKADFDAQQQLLSHSEQLIRSVPNPQKEIVDIQQKIEEFRKTGVGGKQLPRIIQLLSQSAAGRDIVIISIGPREDMRASQENLPAGVNKVYIEMIFTCSFKTLGEYIKALTELPGVFSIESIAVEKVPLQLLSQKDAARAAASSRDLQVDLIISTFTIYEL
jgi:Tfp pilus assembly protein PilO